MKTRVILCWLLMALFCLPMFAQMQDPVQFKAEWKEISATEAEIVFTGTIDAGWHVYSTELGDGGPTSATFNIDEIKGAELVGKLTPGAGEIDKMDPIFGMQVRYFEKSAKFTQKVKLTGGDYVIKGYLEYGACNDENCLPPTAVDFSYSGKAQAAAQAPSVQPSDQPKTPAPVSEVKEDSATMAVDSTASAPVQLKGTNDYWKPVIKELSEFGETQQQDALGLAITLIFGASALNALSTNAIFNIFFFLMLVVFAASFFGAFEITLPSKWSNAVDSKAEATTGLLSIFLMAFTLSLVSFSCTGPIIGFLLVEVSTTGSIIAPALGMLGFAIALALPFTLFAMFPSWLKSMPKSGGWMNVIKVVLGFLELAFALKFLSVADLAYGWRLLDRETFLALWIVIFGLLGFYLLGKIKFPHDDDSTKVGVGRFFLALISLAFAVYMVPGLWGAPLKAVSAFAPPMQTQDFNLYDDEVHAKFQDFDAGMEYARQQGKPVMIDFTGYGCVNCRKMELAVWTDPQVSKMLKDDYVLITLYVDEKAKLPEPIKIMENGKERTLRTVGDKWSYLQRSKFGANAQPFYVLIDNEGNPLNKSYSYDEDVAKYIDFLQTGLKNYKK